MKANEIMTGDYLRIAQTGKIIKIVAVDEPSGSVDYFDGDAGGALTISVEKIEPIPLTAEILEKNGFVVEPEYCYDNPLQYCEIIDGLWISISGEKYFEGKLEYVHELQHALRLCGIDKEIVL